MPYSGALQAAQPGMKQTSYVREGLSVRRLTPTECERLQGFPDGFHPDTVSSRVRLRNALMALDTRLWATQWLCR